MSSSPLVLRNAHVLDVRAGEYQRADVLIKDGMIHTVGVVNDVPVGTDELDLTGKYLLPGLIDCHVHATASNADLGSIGTTSPTYVAARSSRLLEEMLKRGFTSVRDAGGADYGLSAAQSEGYFAGPRVFFCGSAISQTGGHGDFRGPGENTRSHCCASVGRVADGVPAVREAARDELRKGAHHIKIMASGGIASKTDRMDSTQYSDSEIAAIVEEAAAANRYVAAHAYTPRAINRCLELGVRTIEHGNLADRRSFELFVEHNAFLVPTLSTHWALTDEGRKFGLSEESWKKVGTIFEDGVETVREAFKRGVKIAFATDLLGGMQRHQSYEFEIRARIQPLIDVVRSATVVAAELLQREGELGEIVEGAIADMVILNADPLEDIEVLSKFEEHGNRVIQDGRFVA